MEETDRPLGRARPRAVRAARQPANPDLVAEVAAGLFRAKGYSATSTREIAAGLGIQKASLYHHIGSKEDLLFDLCMASIRRIRGAVEAAVASEPDPLARVRALIRAHVVHVLEDQDRQATMLFELRCLRPARRRQVIAERDAYESMVRDVLAGAQRAGVLRREPATADLARVLLGAMNWPVFWYRRRGALTPADLADLVAETFLAGSAAR